MCTVTIVPFHDGLAHWASSPVDRQGWTRQHAALRIVCNRDESRERPAALPPQRRRFGQRAALLPVDPLSDGTWIAVNDAGLAMVLLNQNPSLGASPRDPMAPSRGSLIPALLGCGTLHGAKRLACRLAERPFARFRLILTDCRAVVEIAASGRQTRIVEMSRLDRPLLYTSSGLGDELVDAPRRKLFQESFGAKENWPREQIAYHRHSWPGREHLSVCMRRGDACTVSCTVLELGRRSAVMTYFAQAPDEAGRFFAVALDLQATEAA